MPKYANAKDILPEKLLNQIKEQYTGMLYVPEDIGNSQIKKQLVLNMAEHGAGTAKIASVLGITRRRVNQILTEMQKKNV